ncbi:fimbrial protein [Herbaspirillum sp. NPDC101396]|uniref:fimbrial protein n=1 Tax=Herbaspirillum sp. NPDC101396 TaxID=3364005 RepID=UPI00383BC71B
MHASKYGRRFLPSMTLPTRAHSGNAALWNSAGERAFAPGGALFKKLLLALLLNLAFIHSVWATCSFIFVAGFGSYMPTKAITGSAAPVGTVVYDETWTDAGIVNCPVVDVSNRISSNRRILAKPIRGGFVTGPVGLQFDSDIEFSGATSSGPTTRSDGDYVYFEYPLGITRVTVKPRLRYKKTNDAALGAGLRSPQQLYYAGVPRIFIEIFAGVAFPEKIMNLSTDVRSYGSTCNLTVPPAVTLRSVPQRLFTGIGTVPAERTNFNISADCSGVVAGQVVGVSFSESSRHASGAAGVIAVSEGDGKAAGVALQIINTTSGRPIAFNALEPGTPPPSLNGMYNFPMRVQYFQTASTVGTGTVTGTTVVTMQYR